MRLAFHDRPEVGGSPQPHDLTASPERWLRCRVCGAPLAREADRLPAEHGSDGAYVNPLGVVFAVVTVQDAPGALPLGSPTPQDSWFPGYTWQHALCARCHSHIGWRYAALHPPARYPSFFGLRTEALSP